MLQGGSAADNKRDGLSENVRMLKSFDNDFGTHPARVSHGHGHDRFAGDGDSTVGSRRAHGTVSIRSTATRALSRVSSSTVTLGSRVSRDRRTSSRVIRFMLVQNMRSDAG